MNITVFAERFEDGSWRKWEHSCSGRELDDMLVSARRIAFDRTPFEVPVHTDYLNAAGRLFNVQSGSSRGPLEGDVEVFAVMIDHVLIGIYDKIRSHLGESAQFSACAISRFLPSLGRKLCTVRSCNFEK